MAEGATLTLSMLETLLDRKLGDIVTRVIRTQVDMQFSGLREEIAALKQEFVTTAAANTQQQAECLASISALSSQLPGSHPSTQNSGTTLSSGAELKSQPIPDADYAAYWNPQGPNDEVFSSDGFQGWSEHFSASAGWAGRASAQCSFEGSPSRFDAEPRSSAEPAWMHEPQNLQYPNGHHLQQPALMSTATTQPPATSAGPVGMPLLQNQQFTIGQQLQQPALMISSTLPPPPFHSLSDRRSPALHRRHNPKSCMVCRGSFRKLSSCKDHMLKCTRSSSGCRFLANCDFHQLLIRPFSGATVEERWESAVSEWIHRKA
jgi:hypothetical protein